jgi:hypothetical protein
MSQSLHCLKEESMKTSVLQFDEVFSIDPDGTPVVKRMLIFRSMPLMPGARCAKGFKFGGTDISTHVDHPVIVYDRGTHLEVLGFARFTEDKPNKNWVKGWALIRMEPWSLYGFYHTKEQAAEDQKEAGEGFEVRYGSKRIPDGEMAAFGCDPKLHVAMHYPRKKMYHEQVRITGALPHGMSGGAVWHVGSDGVPTLVAIASNYDAGKKFMRGTRINPLLFRIRDELRADMAREGIEPQDAGGRVSRFLL